MKFLVVINPTSGKGEGENIFNEYIKSYLISNNIEYDLFVSPSKRSIEYFIKKYNFTDKNIMLLGGDGSLFEIFQGLKD